MCLSACLGCLVRLACLTFSEVRRGGAGRGEAPGQPDIGRAGCKGARTQASTPRKTTLDARATPGGPGAEPKYNEQLVVQSVEQMMMMMMMMTKVMMMVCYRKKNQKWSHRKATRDRLAATAVALHAQCLLDTDHATAVACPTGRTATHASTALNNVCERETRIALG